jgi:rod shape-determining protein MreD
LKTGLALLALGALAPMLQSALAPYLSAALCPDLGLLLVVAVGLSGRSIAGGLLFSVFVGFVADLLSGALLGQHALLRVLAFAAARSANVHVNLVGVGAKGIFVAVLTVLNGLVMGGITAFFSPGTGFAAIGIRELALGALVNALAAPLVTLVVSFALTRLDDEGGGRHLVRLEPRRWSA